jgi:hypothetical protein
MRTTALVLTLALVVALGAWFPAIAGADSQAPSISRDARGPQPTADSDPLGGPPTPRFYVLGQTTIFAFGVVMLVVAAALGAYTLLLVRRTPVRR